MNRIVFAAALACVLGLVLNATTARSAAQRTLTVPAQYATIQAAVNAAQPSDLVLVSPGTYEERVDFLDKAITVQSSDGPWVTTIDAMRTGTAVNVGYLGVFDGFTVTGGLGASADDGGGVKVDNGIVRRCVIIGNEARWGGGILSENFSQILDNVIENNTATGNSFADLGGGGVCWGPPSAYRPVVRGNVIVRNESRGNGGGIAGWSGGAIEGNVIADNRAGLKGGGVFCGGSMGIRSNVIGGNDAALGGGLALEWHYYGNVHCNTICDNRASADGGGLHVTLSGYVTFNDIVWGNAAARVGQEMWIDQSAVIRIDTSCIRGGLSGLHVESGAELSWGPAMFTSDPNFVDAPSRDYHLRADSPYIDVGRAVLGTQVDVDGDPRAHGIAVDLGADEVHPRLYTTGHAAPGGVLTVKVAGPPGAPVAWGFSLTPRFRNPPIAVPGVGALLLDDPFAVLPVGRIPASGVLDWPLAIPTSVPLGTRLPMQALIGTTLGNGLLAVVRPVPVD